MIHFQINDDGILELQTLPQDEASDDEVFINQELLDTIFSSAEDTADADTEQTIEDILQEMESTGDVTPSGDPEETFYVLDASALHNEQEVQGPYGPGEINDEAQGASG